jgi:hypothetical protein
MRSEPWRRFESRVDPEEVLDPAERARRAKISYRAFLRSKARKAAKGRAAARHRRETALRRRLAAGPSPSEAAAFARERDDLIHFQIIWSAAQRGELGLASLALHQLMVRSDCLLCRRPFVEADREHWSAVIGSRSTDIERTCVGSWSPSRASNWRAESVPDGGTDGRG